MRGISLAVLSCMFLALHPILAKLMLSYMSPWVFVGLTSFLGALLLMSILEVEHKIREIKNLSLRDVLVLFAVAMLSGVIAPIVYIFGLSQTSVANAVLLLRFNAVLIAFLGVVLLKEKFSLNQFIGTVIMVLGAVVIVTKCFSVPLTSSRGDLLVLAATVCFTLGNVIMKKHLCRVPPEVIVIGRNAFAGILILSLTYSDVPNNLTSQGLIYLGLFVILVIAVGQSLWYSALEHTSAIEAGLASFSLPVFGIIYAVGLMGETLEEHQIMGGALIIFGLLAIELHLSSIKRIGRRLKGIHFHSH